MKTSPLYLIALLCLLSACKKDDLLVEPVKQEYVQHFTAVIDQVPVTIQNTQSKDRGKLHGQWTGVGLGNGQQIDMYTVNVLLQKETPTALFEPKLQFQIFDLHTGLHRITGENSFYESFASYIVLSKRYGNGDNEVKRYVANTQKKPFEIEITKYEYPTGSIVPFVGGKLNGTLYNENNVQDSIVIKNGNFEVRF